MIPMLGGPPTIEAGREHGVEEVRDRGLWLVATLANRWGIHDGSSHVWFELEFPDPSNRPTVPELGEAERPPKLG